MAAMFVSSYFLCVLLLLSLATTTTQCYSVSSNKDIFILAGQSNMAGRGGVKGGKFFDASNIPKQCKPNPSILKLTSNLQWVEAREPLHVDIDVGKICGIGPGLAFANEVLRITKGRRRKSDDFYVGLVPCAKGGTKIGEWSKGSILYDELVKRANESVKGNNGGGGGGGRIKALLWYQGESDTVREDDADGYKVKMENFVRDIRLDLHLPSLLVIQVALASGEGKFIEKVREAQLGIRVPNVKCVDAKGLPLKEDKLHLTAMSEAHLGIRLAHAYLASTTTTTNHHHHHQFNHTQSYIAS